MRSKAPAWLKPEMIWKVFGTAFFVYLFFGFMLLPCLNTITQIFTTKNAAGEVDPLAVIRKWAKEDEKKPKKKRSFLELAEELL